MDRIPGRGRQPGDASPGGADRAGNSIPFFGLWWSVRVPMPDARLRGAFFKVGQRKALAIAIVSLAAAWTEEDDGAVRSIRLAWGSVGPTVLRFPDLERALEGKPLTAHTLRPAAEEAARRVRPIDDVRASASYRRRVTGNLLYRLANP